ncbi:MAG: CDP-alcohol phosphatidyltransferase family protein [Hyphomicrobiales bacterium]|nr:CDP-alcohol phosphatidyltransferase family protein [Hyphomicrobiales bacterium]
MPDLKNRRPLNSRNTRWADRITRALASRKITPNQISLASMVAAFVAALAFWLAGHFSDVVSVGCLLVLAALSCQLRLLCNLFDGMVAVEAGKSGPDGPFWNEFPDRVSDVLIFVGVGLGVGVPALGWAAAAASVLTAYTRELGVSIGLEPDFSGPMAKQHRMALLTVSAILAIFETFWLASGTVLTVALWIAAIGAGFTTLRRAGRIRKRLLKN